MQTTIASVEKPPPSCTFSQYVGYLKQVFANEADVSQIDDFAFESFAQHKSGQVDTVQLFRQTHLAPPPPPPPPQHVYEVAQRTEYISDNQFRDRSQLSGYNTSPESSFQAQVTPSRPSMLVLSLTRDQANTNDNVLHMSNSGQMSITVKQLPLKPVQPLANRHSLRDWTDFRTAGFPVIPAPELTPTESSTAPEFGSDDDDLDDEMDELREAARDDSSPSPMPPPVRVIGDRSPRTEPNRNIIAKAAPAKRRGGTRKADSPKQPRKRTKTKTQCPDCKKTFSSQHEARRHQTRSHQGQRFVIVDWTEDKVLSGCSRCDIGYKYGAHYNATAHLWRRHVEPKKPKPHQRYLVPKDGGSWKREDFNSYAAQFVKVVRPTDEEPEQQQQAATQQQQMPYNDFGHPLFPVLDDSTLMQDPILGPEIAALATSQGDGFGEPFSYEFNYNPYDMFDASVGAFDPGQLDQNMYYVGMT